MDRCGWCGKELPQGQHFCSDDCRERCERILARDRRCIKWFLLLLAAGVLALFAGALDGQDALVGGGMLLIGSDILLFPLVTPETTALLGVRAARRAGRALGAVTMAAGVWIGWF